MIELTHSVRNCKSWHSRVSVAATNKVWKTYVFIWSLITKEHRVVLGVDAATLPHVCRLTGCPRGGRVCRAEEGMLPPRGAVSAKGNECAASKWSELERPRWQRSLSQIIWFFIGKCASKFQMLYNWNIVLVLHVLGYSSGKTTLGAPEPREDEGLTQATHGFVGEGTLSQVWPFLCWGWQF